MDKRLAWGAPTFTLTRSQWVPGKLEEIFEFFENPENLSRITPDWLKFEILAMNPKVIQNGTIIQYRIRWFGVPCRWITSIDEWSSGQSFVDSQRNGPYVLWQHSHWFEESAGGVTIIDKVQYRLPFGPIGVFVHRFLVRSQLNEIFDYRTKVIAESLASGKVFEIAPSPCKPLGA